MAEKKWGDYLRAPLTPEKFSRSRATYLHPMRVHRDLMERLARRYHPARIACLGAGFLNDIPLEAFIQEAETLYLVDWIPGIAREGFAGSIFDSKDDNLRCLLCDDRIATGRYCAAFRPPIRAPEQVCASFEPMPGRENLCVHYAPGDQPNFLEADITLGRGGGFARRSESLVARGKTLRQVFQRALAEGKRCARIEEEMEIPADSIDLVTASMVVSQFDHEPYAFFARLLAEKFGMEKMLENEEHLRPQVEQLRSLLFQIQAEGLVREMYRIVNKTQGRVFFSVEFFRSLNGEDRYFLVHEIPRAMETIAEYFQFEFESIPAEETITTFSQNEGTSVVQCFVLTPITD